MATKTKKAAPTEGASRRQPMGLFWLGFVFIAAAFVLMGVRNYYSYIDWKALQKVVDAPEVFRTLHEKFPNLIPPQEPPLVRSDIPVHKGDAMIGDVDAAVQVVVFSDPGCPACMSVGRKLLELRKLHGDDVRIVYKFLPADKGNNSMEAAIFSQIANSKGLFWIFHDRLVEAGKADTEAYAKLLEKLGISLDQQRDILKKQSEFLVRNVDRNVAEAKKLGLEKPPVIFVNAYRLGQDKLPVEGFMTYVQRLLDGQPIVQPKEG
ncbi:MAG: thioredoxin domain-containing protein [Proteobacteria bacterium]|nr:thioredoxin domain-containing protein [Pseudomonadota bacterium]